MSILRTLIFSIVILFSVASLALDEDDCPKDAEGKCICYEGMGRATVANVDNIPEQVEDNNESPSKGGSNQ